MSDSDEEIVSWRRSVGSSKFVVSDEHDSEEEHGKLGYLPNDESSNIHRNTLNSRNDESPRTFVSNKSNNSTCISSSKQRTLSSSSRDDPLSSLSSRVVKHNCSSSSEIDENNIPVEGSQKSSLLSSEKSQSKRSRLPSCQSSPLSLSSSQNSSQSVRSQLQKPSQIVDDNGSVIQEEPGSIRLPNNEEKSVDCDYDSEESLSICRKSKTAKILDENDSDKDLDVLDNSLKKNVITDEGSTDDKREPDHRIKRKKKKINRRFSDSDSDNLNNQNDSFLCPSNDNSIENPASQPNNNASEHPNLSNRERRKSKLQIFNERKKREFVSTTNLFLRYNYLNIELYYILHHFIGQIC